MTNFRPITAALVLALAFLAGGCREEAPSAAPLGADAWFPMQIGSVKMKVQMMVRDMELQQGMMHRPRLADDEGMIFVYPSAGGRSFWMRNVSVPLDIGFFSPEGLLTEVRPLNPFDENPVTSYSSNIQFAVETNQGWYREHGLKPGAQLDLAALRKALLARGFVPKAIGVN